MEQATILYWVCPQNSAHYFDIDDWRVLPDENSIGWRGRFARCPHDGRVMEAVITTVGVSR